MEITFENVSFTYQPGTPFEGIGLQDINLNIKSGSYTAIIGHTGSGKSTLLQHLNALLKPTQGSVKLGERVITPESNNKQLKTLRQKVGMVFQFPESQLFEATVEKDVAFGPQNFGVEPEIALKRAREAVALVGLPETVLQQSPFDLSGGQMRRVAIAGVLAMQPEVLVLDEPTAGLDPVGRQEMLKLFDKLHQQGMTIIMVTHQMEDVASYAQDVIVLQAGKIVKQGTPEMIFADHQWLLDKQLDEPLTVKFAEHLIAKGFAFDHLPLTTNQLAEQLVNQLAKEVGEQNE